MAVVHKQFIKVTDLDDVVSIEVPEGSHVLKVGNQYETMAFWYLCDEEEEKKERKWFRITGTGHRVHKDNGFLFDYIDTVQFNDGRLVLHVFEIEEQPF